MNKRRAKTSLSITMRFRLSLFTALCLVIGAVSVSLVSSSQSATPASGAVSESNPRVTWTGAIMPANPDVLNSPRCNGADACDNFNLTISPPSASYGPYVVEVRLQPQGDWDMEIYNPGGAYRTGSGNGVGAAEVVTLYNPPAGTYRIAAFPFSPIVGTDGNSYAASAELMHQPPSGSSPPAGENVGFTNYPCPSGKTCTNDFGEPSIGSNWKTGNVMFAGGGFPLQTFRVSFNDQNTPATATWTDVSGNQHIANSPRVLADPILFTDPRTGRTFAGQLEGLTPVETMEYTDDDGNLFIPSQGSGIVSGVDHETIGGGPLAPPLTRDPNLPRPAYPNGVYYCAQALGPANCALSLDGGQTFGPAVETWTTECGGIHGHIKVAPNDGTAYVPNRGCGGRQGMAVSTNNGMTWTIRTIPGTGTGESDPSIGIGSDGTVYFGFVDGDGHPKVAVTHDKGVNWETLGGAKFIDVGTSFGLQNAVFASTVAGDPNRAAFTFHGSPTAGPFQDASFNGVWDLYVAETFDGGATWTTVKASTDPTQRGCIWLGGGDNPCRNLLDFMDVTVDQEGRVIVGYADGCTGGCATDPANTAKSVWGTIARQSKGKRLFAQFDPVQLTATTTSLMSSSPNPSTVGQPVTFTASVAANSGTPTGTVTFNDGVAALGTATLDGAGHASFTTSTLSPGSHSITATYGGDSNFASSVSAVLTQVVNGQSGGFGPKLLHFNGNAPEDSGCTGVGAADSSSTNCSTLTESATLSTSPAAKWLAVAGVNGSADRNIYDPNWLWTLSNPTTLSGPMTIQWWQACNGECVALGGTWRIRLWADGVVVYQNDNVTGTPALPNVPSLLTATVNLPTVSANSKFVLHIDTVFSDTGQGATIYYDSQSPCPGALTGPCDSTVTMPVIDPNNPPPSPTPTPVPSPVPPGPGTPRFQTYVPDASYSGGEPSIGANWVTGNAMYLASYNPLRISFDDCSSPAMDTWTNTEIPTAVSLDPILFTDHTLPPGMANRTFVSQLTGQDSITFYTDDDGANYSPSQGGGIPSGVDHQTIGAGPYKPNTTPAAGPRSSYPNAVYYCSQESATAFCARSDDGGATFGPGIPIYQLLQCTGIHGHVKVGPDGTVYVPNRSCGGKASVVVSNDNGVTWSVRPAPASSTTGFLVDPSVGIGTNNVGKPSGQSSNTIYLGYQASDGHPRIAVSHDQGLTWVNDQDVGTVFGIQNSTFPEVVAGDDNRAAYAFLGTTVSGDYTDQATYNQSAPWHLYIATTFDGGHTWTTADATPDDPVQRGSICNLGTVDCDHSPNDRNLLDFMDATVDAQGRTLVAYPDGCVGRCVTKPSGNFPNSYTSRASVARQSGGRRLFAAFDPIEPNLPGAPKPKAEISSTGGPTVVSWPATDNGGAPITSYKVYRRNGPSGSFNLVATVNTTTFSDNNFPAPATGNAYRVTAVNAIGEGRYCGEAVPVVVTYESSCVAPYITVGGEGIPGTIPTDPTGGELSIERLNVGEPFTNCNDNSLSFIMKVKSLDPQNTGMAVLPPNSEWHILFGVTDTQGNPQSVFLEMDTFSPDSLVKPRTAIGRRDPTPTGTQDTRVCTNDAATTCPAISATFNRDGTIIFKLNLATPISFAAPAAPATGNAFTWDGSAIGTDIGTAQVITGTTYVLVGATRGLLETVQTTSGEEYTRVGNTACSTALPTASLTGNPTSGNAPLTVNFDASASSNPESCSTIASYTLDFGDGSPGVTQPSPAFSHTYNSAGDYAARLTVTNSAGKVSTNAAQVAIHVTSPAPSPTPTPAPACIEDNDSRVVYSGGWHLVNATGASDGHFRYHTGNSPSHSAGLDFNIPAGSTGSISYAFAKSPKGGTGDVYLDGVKQATINYAVSSGSTQAPQFNPAYKVQYTGLPAGSHKLEIKNMNGVVYVDQFCVTSSTITSQPTSGPGNTTNQSGSAGAGQTTSSNYQPASGSQQMTVTVESTLNVPFKIALVSPSGLTLQTVDASGGIATLNQPVTQGGTYVIKVVNVSLGPLQFTTTVTPQVAR